MRLGCRAVFTVSRGRVTGSPGLKRVTVECEPFGPWHCEGLTSAVDFNQRGEGQAQGKRLGGDGGGRADRFDAECVNSDGRGQALDHR